MMFMNEYEIESAVSRVDRDETPNLAEAVDVLYQLMRWTDRNSDGWAYWPKPARSAASLMALVQGVDRFDPRDVSAAAVAKAVRPVKAFLTRQGAALGVL